MSFTKTTEFLITSPSESTSFPLFVILPAIISPDLESSLPGAGISGFGVGEGAVDGAGVAVGSEGIYPPPPPPPEGPPGLGDGLGDGLGEVLGDGLGEVLGLGDGLGFGEVLGLGDGLGFGEVLGLGDGLGFGEVLGLGDGSVLGDGLGTVESTNFLTCTFAAIVAFPSALAYGR